MQTGWQQPLALRQPQSWRTRRRPKLARQWPLLITLNLSVNQSQKHMVPRPSSRLADSRRGGVAASGSTLLLDAARGRVCSCPGARSSPGSAAPSAVSLGTPAASPPCRLTVVRCAAAQDKGLRVAFGLGLLLPRRAEQPGQRRAKRGVSGHASGVAALHTDLCQVCYPLRRLYKQCLRPLAALA